MKYYNELIELETRLIEMSGIKALARALAIAANQMSGVDREEALWKLSDLIDAQDKITNEAFYNLFETVRDDKLKKGNKK